MKYLRLITFNQFTILFASLIMPALVNAQNTTVNTNEAFIAAQKANAPAIMAPYQTEVAQLAATAEKNAQTPEIQAYIQQLKNHSININDAIPKPTANNTGQILIFVSSSMPLTSVVQWMQQAQKIKAPLIMRGFVNNSAQDTKRWVKQLIERNNNRGGIQINPVLFERFNIQQVPAVVAIDSTDSCPAGMSCRTPDYDVVYGNTRLNEALKTLATQGDAARGVAQQRLTFMRATP